MKLINIVTAHEADPDEPIRGKVDSAIYLKEYAPTATGSVNWSRVELSFEFHDMTDADDPFDDAEDGDFCGANSRKNNLDRIVSSAKLVFDHQHRTHHFTVVILGTMARIVRWDRSGVLYTEKFNYKKETTLAKFLYCYTRLDVTQRGHDPSAVPITSVSTHYKLMRNRANNPRRDEEGNEVDKDIREAFAYSIKDTQWRFKLTVKTDKGLRDFIVGKPTFVSSTLAGRGTRGYIAIDVTDPTGPFVYLKDAWRVDHPRMHQEGTILSSLNAANVPNIPTLVCHGDVPDQATVTDKVWRELHPQENATDANNETVDSCPLKAHRHYRMVVKEVAEPLSSFTNGRELVKAILYILRGEYNCCLLAILRKLMHTRMMKRTKLPTTPDTSTEISA